VGARKRSYTRLSRQRYLEKAVKIHASQGIPLEKALEHAEARTEAWEKGFGKYHDVRKVLKAFLANEGAEMGIVPSMHGMFYACLNELKKNGKYLSKVCNLRDYIAVKYPVVAQYDEAVDLILRLAGFPVRPPEEEPATPHEKAG